MKTISVAILSSTDFSTPSEVGQTTLTFGGTGDEPSFLSCTCKHKDVNGDGLPDLVYQFSTKVAFKCGDAVGILSGLTITGIPFEGTLAVVISPCK
jgi:hypothetical protein